MCGTFVYDAYFLSYAWWKRRKKKKKTSGATPLELLVDKLWWDGPEPPVKNTAAESPADFEEDLTPECLKELKIVKFITLEIKPLYGISYSAYIM